MNENLREAIILEDQFRQVFAREIVGFMRLLNLLRATDSDDWGKRHFTELVSRSHQVETFLDDFGARNNKAFSFVTELVASLRGFGKVAVSMKHLASRLPRYNVSLEPGLAGAFLVETNRTVRFLNESVAALSNALSDALKQLDVETPADALDDSQLADETARHVLPHNIDEEDILDEERKIAEVATRYLGAAERIGAASGGRKIEGDANLREFVLKHLDEEKARFHQTLVHSVQSKYDTFIKSTSIEARTPALPRLRGHASLALHLCEMNTELVHFYVRHENDIRYEAAKDRISQFVDKAAVLDRAVNFALLFAQKILDSGRVWADEVLRTFLKVQELQLTLGAESTLHARPISLIVKVVNHHSTPVELEIDGDRCNAGSIMELIMAIGAKPSARDLKFRGDARTLADLRRLFDANFGEDGLEHLPPELEYLRTRTR